MRALERYLSDRLVDGAQRTLKVKDLPVLINGDDILFRADAKLYEYWLEEIKVLEFKLSVGKNYVHKNIFTINSKMYRYTSTGFTEITYLNIGQLIGQSKSGALQESKPIWQIYNEVIAGAHSKVDASNRYLHYNRVDLQRASNKGLYNYFLPKALGGVGLHRPSGLIVNLTGFQVKVANFMHSKFQRMLSTPVKDSGLTEITLRNKHKREVLEFYPGGRLYLSVPTVGPIPDGYQEYRSTKLPVLLFFDTVETLSAALEPDFSYTKLSRESLRQFRIAYKAGISSKPYFGLNSALEGNYEYKLVESIVTDEVECLENVASVIAQDALRDVLLSISGGTVPGTL